MSNLGYMNCHRFLRFVIGLKGEGAATLFQCVVQRGAFHRVSNGMATASPSNRQTPRPATGDSSNRGRHRRPMTDAHGGVLPSAPPLAPPPAHLPAWAPATPSRPTASVTATDPTPPARRARTPHYSGTLQEPLDFLQRQYATPAAPDAVPAPPSAAAAAAARTSIDGAAGSTPKPPTGDLSVPRSTSLSTATSSFGKLKDS